MLSRLLLVFILLPLVEMALLIRIGQWLGLWPTLGLVVTTGVVGAMLARSQGMQVLRGIRTELSVGRMPTERLLDGLMILIGGIVLLTPGVLTDLLGIALLLPFTRARLKRSVRDRFDRMIRSGQANIVFIR